MAPTAALDYIGKVIDGLESGDIPQRVTKYYELKHADAETVVEYLTAHFGAADGTKARPRPATDGGPAVATVPSGVPNAPSFIAYSQLNMVTVQATEPQIKELLAIPEEFGTAAVVALGWPAKPFPKKLNRRPLAEMAYLDRFGDVLPVAQ